MTEIDPAAPDALRAWDPSAVRHALGTVVPYPRTSGFTIDDRECAMAGSVEVD